MREIYGVEEIGLLVRFHEENKHQKVMLIWLLHSIKKKFPSDYLNSVNLELFSRKSIEQESRFSNQKHSSAFQIYFTHYFIYMSTVKTIEAYKEEIIYAINEMKNIPQDLGRPQFIREIRKHTMRQ